jgi:hypothetical protein
MVSCFPGAGRDDKQLGVADQRVVPPTSAAGFGHGVGGAHWELTGKPGERVRFPLSGNDTRAAGPSNGGSSARVRRIEEDGSECPSLPWSRISVRRRGDLATFAYHRL